MAVVAVAVMLISLAERWKLVNGRFHIYFSLSHTISVSSSGR